MRINTLTIQNFKTFENQEFHLNDRFTVFIGDNATGKTTVLDAVATILNPVIFAFLGQSPRPILEKEVRVVWMDGQPKPQFPCAITAVWKIRDLDRLVWPYYLNGSSNELSWKLSFGGDSDPSSIFGFSIRTLDQSRAGNKPLIPLVAYFGTGRLWSNEQEIAFQAQKEGILMAFQNALTAKASPKDFLDWYKTLEDSVQKFNRKRDIEHLNATKLAIMALIPDRRWQNMHFDYRSNELTGTFTDDNGKPQELTFSQLSDGYRSIIAMAGDIIYRAIQLNPHLGEDVIRETPGMVLIDELDMHLHPNWQRRIVQDLKEVFPRIQFVATTHSPFIVQSLQADEIWNLDRQADVNPSELPLADVAEEIMGVESSFASENAAAYEISKTILQRIQEGEDLQALKAEIQHISNPGLRAFLEIQRLAALSNETH